MIATVFPRSAPGNTVVIMKMRGLAWGWLLAGVVDGMARRS
jgi:hypothetical protein